MPDQDDIAQSEALHLVDDVLDMSLLPGRNALLVGDPGERHGVRAMPGRAQLRHHVVPRPRSEPRACD